MTTEHVIDYLNNQLVEAEQDLIAGQWQLSEAKGTSNYLLQYRIKPLLDDAIDAIEIEVPHIAIRRIKHVLKLLEGKKS
jgi:hypothetical protein|tara:strand:- start:561 stop:797 length:237 start_codon:yes stop_codon:yes gene_type:complete